MMTSKSVGVRETQVPTPVKVIDDPARVRSALSPLRRRMLKELRRPHSASGLAEPLGVSRQKLNYHLKQLEAQGLVHLVEERPRRGFTEQVFQTSARALVVDPEVLGEVGSDPVAQQDRLSSSYMVSAASRLLSDVAALQSGAEEAGKRLLTLTEEVEIAFRSPRELKAFTEDLTSTVMQLAARYHQADDDRSRPYKLMLALHPRREDGANVEPDEEGAK